MSFKPSKIVIVGSAVFFAFLHFLIVAWALIQGGDTGMIAIMIDFPLFWLLNLFGPVQGKHFALVCYGGGTFLYLGVGASIGYFVQLAGYFVKSIGRKLTGTQK